ncbi:MAG: signal recognition particle receptor subunit alpha, partial [Gemmatimonadota bacterium]
MSEAKLELSVGRPRRSLWRKIVDFALMDVNTIVRGGIDEETIGRLERLLLEADFGVDATAELVDELERAVERGKIAGEEDLRRALAERLREILTRADPASPARVDSASRTRADSASRTRADSASRTRADS